MEERFYPLMLILYFMFVMLSLFVVTGPLLYDLQKKRPQLVDKRWKRMLWLLSCFFFIPVGIAIFSIPIFIFKEIKEFLQGH